MRNLKWIKAVGKDVLSKCDLDAEAYIKEIIQGSRLFDELAIVLACASHNIHRCILLDGDYWTTQAGNEHRDCEVRLAYVGEGSFKEIFPLKMPYKSDDEDLQETGLLQCEENSDADTEKSIDDGFDDELSTSEEDLDNNDSRAHDFDTENEPEPGSNTEPSRSDDNSTDPIDDDQPSTSVVKKSETSSSPGHSHSMDIDSHETVSQIDLTGKDNLTGQDDAGYDSDLQITAVSIPEKVDSTIIGKVHRSRQYNCYICHFKSEMQVTFVSHFKKEHSGQKYHCDFCAAPFDSCNGLFKHEHSHQYL